MNFFRSISWNDELKWFEAVHPLGGGDEVHFYAESEGPEELHPLERSRDLFFWICEHADEIVRSIGDEYYPVYLEHWAGEKVIPREEFESEMLLRSIVFHSDEEKSANWAQPDCFGDHSLCVRMGNGNVIEEIMLEG